MKMVFLILIVHKLFINGTNKYFFTKKAMKSLKSGTFKIGFSEFCLKHLVELAFLSNISKQATHLCKGIKKFYQSDFFELKFELEKFYVGFWGRNQKNPKWVKIMSAVENASDSKGYLPRIITAFPNWWFKPMRKFLKLIVLVVSTIR